MAVVKEFRYGDRPIEALWPNVADAGLHGTESSGLRLLFYNQEGDFCLYSPVDDDVLLVPSFEGRPQVLWDVADPKCFVALDESEFHTYCYRAMSYDGPTVDKLEATPRPTVKHRAVLFRGGVLTCLVSGAADGAGADKLTSAALLSHTELAEPMADPGKLPPDRLLMRFEQAVALGRFYEAWECAGLLPKEDEAALLKRLAEAALRRAPRQPQLRALRSAAASRRDGVRSAAV